MEKDPTKSSPKIVYSKGPCFGKCPIYTLTIYNTGFAKFKGRKYTKMDGEFVKQLDKDTYVALIKVFRGNRVKAHAKRDGVYRSILLARFHNQGQ